MSRQEAVLAFVTGVDTAIAGRKPSGPTAPFDLSTAALPNNTSTELFDRRRRAAPLDI